MPTTTYYTAHGKLIYNPKQYAKTGAPMYTSKYNRTHNVNAPTAIYQLHCEHNKTYVGKTQHLDQRMQQHFSGNGSQVTRKFKPIGGEVVDVVHGFFSNAAEHAHTKRCVKQHGYDNVRGGKWVNAQTLHASPSYGDEAYASDCDEDDSYDDDSSDSGYE